MTTGQLGAIVLCGGQSTRMGRDKASLRFGAESLLERMVRLVGGVTANLVLAASVDQQVPDGIQVSRDRSPVGGPLPALLSALDLVHLEHVCVVACDVPLLQPKLLGLLHRLCEGHDGAVPLVLGRRMATCAVYRTAALREARAAFGDPIHRSLQAYLQPLRILDVGPDMLQSVDPQLLSFTPCNTPEEYAAALRRAT